ncbi:hypothetical protein [Mucilaginibacter lappiensis]|uniref:hypothetical protein n=1 Tax=Mucilaginibacter lappiensis TaxID=354630 RepID=UPI003D201DAB
MDSTFDFAVRVNMVYENQFNGQVFHSRIEYIFNIDYRYEAPTVEFLFPLIDQATFAFAQLFHERGKATNLRFHQVPKPKLADIRETLQESIDRWDASAKKFRERGGFRLERFKHLPAIPEHKQYGEQYASTNEQRLTYKLFRNEPLEAGEMEIIASLDAFYQELNKGLASLDYSAFSLQDFLDFRNYIHFAFNFHFFITNELEVTYELYRLVVNESVLLHDVSITNQRSLTYPPLAVLQRIGKYNRASTKDSTLLYLTESVDTALKELRPPEGKLVTVGIWRPRERRKFVSYPIEHNVEAAAVNSEVAQGRFAVTALSQHQHPLGARYMNNYFALLAREFSKPVSHHYEYLLSALLSENIFDLEDPNPDFDYECIVYPSVGNRFKTRNLAVKPAIADKEFQLVGAIEFRVEQGLYDREPLLTGNPASISVATITSYRETRNVNKSGDILW